MGSLFSPFLECPPYTYSCGENKSAMVWLQLKIETVTMNCMHSYHILLPTNALDLKRFFLFPQRSGNTGFLSLYIFLRSHRKLPVSFPLLASYNNSVYSAVCNSRI
jgi:hypothetical protein